ncbi:MAG: alkaline phosphatase D family protein [Bryobacterales bacterium]|nr:alkaline phosphatase D family protein [Bryobacterales bacterium]
MLRRDILRALAASPAGAIGLRGQDRLEPVAVQAGDVTHGRAVVWTRAARPGKMTVRYRTSDSGPARTVQGPALSAATDFTGRVELSGLPDGQRILYEVSVDGGAALRGHFVTPPGAGGDVRFLWSGDMVGQGWGINPDLGGIRIFEEMRKLEPHFFIHSGDSIYADSPVPAEVTLPDGRKWRNRVSEEKSSVAQTLDEFRGCYRYNLLDENVQRFSASVAQIWQWDDHEVTNNWSPSKDFSGDARYAEKNIRVLVERARKAYLEYAPLRLNRKEPGRIYRKISYGPLLDVFVVDMRSYRGPNTFNLQAAESAETVFLGRAQMNWLKQDLKQSRAAWKVIAADMPVGLVVGDGKDAQGRTRYEAIANGNGPALGRELEIAGLLRFLKQNGVKNTVWLTADVHYTAAHYYDPAKAKFADFLPFWEFVSGPLNAGTFGPGVLDDTFGPRVEFARAPAKGQSNLSPLDGMQFFGDVRIDGKSRELTVVLRDMTGTGLYSKTLAVEA